MTRITSAKEEIVLPRITDTSVSRSSTRTISRESSKAEEPESWREEELAENHDKKIEGADSCADGEQLTLPSLPVLVSPKEVNSLYQYPASINNDISPPNTETIAIQKQSEMYEEELKALKENLKQLSIEARDLILECRIRDEEAKKQANDEKKAARKAAKLAEKFDIANKTTLNPTARTLDNLKWFGNGFERSESTSTNRTNELFTQKKECDDDPVSSPRSSPDEPTDEYGPHSRTEKTINSKPTQKKNNNKNGNEIDAKKVKATHDIENYIGRPGSNYKRNAGAILRPITEENNDRTCGHRKVSVSAKTRKAINEASQLKKNEADVKDKLEIEPSEKSGASEHPFEREEDEVKGTTKEEVDFFESQRLRRQTKRDHFDDRLNDLESVSSFADKTIGTSRRSSEVGLPGNKGKDKKWYMDRYRVPKQPMEIALQLYKLGLDFESTRVRELFMSLQKCEGNLKKAIAKEKRDAIEEKKRIERETRERGRREAHRRKMEELETRQAERKEQEAIDSEKRRQTAIERRKHNLELHRSYNNTILSCKASRSFRFSYFPNLPKPKPQVTPSPDLIDDSNSDSSDADSDDEPPKTTKMSRSKSCHSGKALQLRK